jgi:putative tryptophan/tyrosine transport system substrate-binding protein
MWSWTGEVRSGIAGLLRQSKMTCHERWGGKGMSAQHREPIFAFAANGLPIERSTLVCLDGLVVDDLDGRPAAPPWARRSTVGARLPTRGYRMRRRAVLLLLGGAAVGWAGAAKSEHSDKVRRVGLLMVYSADDPAGRARAAAFTNGLEKLGWVNGRNVRFEYRWPGADAAQIRTMAQELVRLAPDVIVCTGTPAALALKQATRTIPIVFVSVSDAPGQGIVEGFAHPGGNMTGFSLVEPSMGGKWLEILKEIAPAVTGVAVIHNPETAPFFAGFVAPLEVTAPLFGVKLTHLPVHDNADLQRAISSVGGEPGAALFLFPDAFNQTHRKMIIELAALYRLPAIYGFPDFPAEGGLLSYGVDSIDLHARAASYVDRILAGEKPANLPVQQPVKYQLVINLKTAQSLGLTVSTSLLARADEVIE